MVIDKMGNQIHNHKALLKHYGRALSRSGPGGSVGDIIIGLNDKIGIICDDTYKHGFLTYKSLKKQLVLFGFTYSTLCKEKIKLHLYGKVDNNRVKAFQTNTKRYGSKGIPRSESCRKNISNSSKLFYKSNKGNLKKSVLSRKAKIRFKNKHDHPLFGKVYTDEEKVKMRNAMLSSLKEKGLTGFGHGNYKCGEYFSEKFNTTFKYRSSYELHFIKLCEITPKIVQLEYESIYINYVFNGKDKLYFPDFIITFSSDTRVIVEVKPRKLMNKPRNKAKFKALMAFVKSSKEYRSACFYDKVHGFCRIGN